MTITHTWSSTLVGVAAVSFVTGAAFAQQDVCWPQPQAQPVAQTSYHRTWIDCSIWISRSCDWVLRVIPLRSLSRVFPEAL